MGRMVLFGWTLALVACARGDDAKPTVAATFGPTIDATTGGTTVTPAATSAPSTDTDTETDDTSEMSTGGDTAPTGGVETDAAVGESSTGDPAAACEPVEGDNECFVCARVECCPEVAACAESAMCTCALECLSDGWDPQTCVVGCGVDGAVSNLVLCGATLCEAPCDAAL